MDLFHSVAPWLFVLVSAGTAAVALLRLKATPSGLLIGGAFVGHALTSVAVRVVAMLDLVPIARLEHLYAGASLIHLACNVAFVAGLFTLPGSLRALARR